MPASDIRQPASAHIAESQASYILLLTATINPANYADQLKAELIQQRQQEYITALEYWGQLADPRISGIVFCENSGTDLTELKTHFDDQVFTQERPIEWLSFDGNQRQGDVHYGYAELGIVDHAIKHSALLGTTSHFIKITGRLTFDQLPALLDRIKPPIEFCADSHRYSADKALPVRMRTQLFISSTRFYQHHLFETRENMLGKCTHIEDYLMRLVWPLKTQTGVQLRFPIEVLPNGFSASIGENYRSLKSRCKSFFRAIIRQIMPWYWL